MREPPGWKALAGRPLVLLALALGMGLWANRILGPPLLLPAAAGLGGSLLLARPRESRTWILGAGFLAGAFLPGPPPPGRIPRVFPPERPGKKGGPNGGRKEGSPRIFASRGRVATSPQKDPSGDLTFLVRAGEGLFRVRWRRPVFRPARGDQVLLQGILRSGSFDRKKASLKTCLTCGTNLVLLEAAPWWSPAAFLDRARQALHDRLVSALSPQSRGVALCLVLGDPSYLPPWEEALFRRTGTAHLLVVSGLHVALVAWFAVRLAGKGKTWVPFLAVAFYALLSGARPPALRAALGFGLWTLGRARGRKGDLAGALAGAALPLLFFDPARAFGASFQVSYAAVAAMALLGPSLGRALRALGLPGGLSLALAFSAAATLGAGPVSLYYFGAFSPWSLLLTPLLTPILGMEVFLSAGALLLPAQAGPALAALHGGILHLLSWADRVLPWTPLFTPWFPPPPLLLGTLLLVSSLLLLLPPGPRIFAWLILFLPFFVPLQRIENRIPRGMLLSVGHGQCLVLDLPGLGVVVHDAGSLWSPRGTARILLDLLRSWGRKRVDLLVVSHADQDHVSALPWLLSALPVRKILLPDHRKSRRLAGLLERIGASFSLLPQGRTLSLPFPGGRLLLFTPGERKGPPNEGGLVLYCRTRTFSLLSPGDLSGPGLERLSRLGPGLAPEILVAPHHGALTGKEEALAGALRPRWVLASRSRAQGPPPAKETYEKAGAQVRWTGREGSLPIPPGKAK